MNHHALRLGESANHNVRKRSCEPKKAHHFMRWVLMCCLGWALHLSASGWVQAQPLSAPWEQVGTSPGASTGEASYTSLAFGPDGKPYVAYTDVSTGSKATVARLNALGSGWEVVGGTGFSDGAAYRISLAFGSDGKPYVAYTDTVNGNGATVMRLNAMETGWEVLGRVGFSDGPTSYTTLAFGSAGRPYVAFQDGINAGKASVMRLNAGGTDWEIVGTRGFSTGQADHLSLAFSAAGKPFVAYQDHGHGNKATVMRLDGAGAAWEEVGAMGGFSAGQAEFLSLVFGPDGKPYLAYQDDTQDDKALVVRLNAAETGWELVGGNVFSAGEADHISLAFGPDSKPYVAYTDESFGDKATVMRLNAAGTAWETVGGMGFSAGEVNYTSLAFGPDGKPYVAFRDDSRSNIAAVMRWTWAVGPGNTSRPAPVPTLSHWALLLMGLILAASAGAAGVRRATR